MSLRQNLRHPSEVAKEICFKLQQLPLGCFSVDTRTVHERGFVYLQPHAVV